MDDREKKALDQTRELLPRTLSADALEEAMLKLREHGSTLNLIWRIGRRVGGEEALKAAAIKPKDLEQLRQELLEKCECDAVGDGPCPVHGQENNLQDQVTHLTAELERWKKFTALAMEYSGVTKLAFSKERLAKMRWDVRLDRDAFEQKDVVTLEHKADASEAEPKYLFIFENCSLSSKHVERMSERLNTWIRSNYKDKIGMLEMPRGAKLLIQKMIGGDLVDVDPHKLGIRVVEVEVKEDE